MKMNTHANFPRAADPSHELDIRVLAPKVGLIGIGALVAPMFRLGDKASDAPDSWNWNVVNKPVAEMTVTSLQTGF